LSCAAVVFPAGAAAAVFAGAAGVAALVPADAAALIAFSWQLESQFGYIKQPAAVFVAGVEPDPQGLFPLNSTCEVKPAAATAFSRSTQCEHPS
jgi:hypothetical protein